MALLHGRGEDDPDARGRSIHILVEMSFDDAIVIDADSLAEGILCDFESAVDIAAERRGEIEVDGEGQGFSAKPMHQRVLVGRLGESQPELLTGLLLIGSSGRGQYPAATDRRVLMVDAGGNRQRDFDGVGGDDCSGCGDMKRRPWA